MASIKEQLIDLMERVIFKITSGRFVFTVVVAGVYAYLAITGGLDEDRINEITLIVLYAYFNMPRTPVPSKDDADEDEPEEPEKPNQPVN